MPANEQTTKDIKKGNQVLEKKAQEKYPFKYLIKHEFELTNKSWKEQLKRRFHIQKWKLNGEKGAEDLEKKLQIFVKKVFRFRNCTKALVIENCKLSKINKVKFIMLIESLRKNPFFENFSYMLTKGKHLCENEDLRRINELIKRVDGLKRMKFYIKELLHYHNITDEGLSYFVEIMKKEKNLQDIQLFFGWCKHLTDKTVQEICKGLQKLVALKAIKLGFVHCKGLTRNGAQVLCETLRNVASLERISLNFDDSPNVLSEDLKEICKAIKPSLTEFSLKFKEFHMTDKEMERLSEALRTMSSIESFFIEFQSFGEEVNDYGMFYFGLALNHMKNLKKLTFDFNADILPKNGLINLAENLRDLTCLRQIYLKFPRSRHITDKGLEELARSLRQLKFLEEVSLIFSQSQKDKNGLICWEKENHNKITDEVFDILIQALAGLSHLKRLDLNFRDSFYMTDKSLKNLNRHLRKMDLRSLSLDFSGCNFTDEGVEILGENLEKMNFLKDLTFIFQSCKNISNSGLKCLAQNLTDLKCIQRIKLIFSSFNTTTKKRDEVYKLLQTIPSIQYVNVAKDL